MNKYQEALSDLSWLAESDGGSVSMDEVKQCTETLQEAVNKVTPTRLIVEEIGNIKHFMCPSCQRVMRHEPVGALKMFGAKNNHCSKCGQALDWSNDEPTKRQRTPYL